MMQETYLPEEQKDFREYLAFATRRRWPMLITGFFIVVVTAAVAVLLPPVYRSTATILIEEQEIPTTWCAPRSAVSPTSASRSSASR